MFILGIWYIVCALRVERSGRIFMTADTTLCLAVIEPLQICPMWGCHCSVETYQETNSHSKSHP